MFHLRRKLHLKQHVCSFLKRITSIFQPLFKFDKAETMIAFWREKQVARKYVSWSRKKSVLGRNQKCKMPQVCMMILPTVKCLSKARMGKPRVVFGLSSHAIASPSDTNLTRPYRHNQGKMESRIGSFMKVHE